MRSSRINVLAFSCLLVASQVQAETYYVSPTGNAAWTECTVIDTPCNGRTAVENAVAGDIVYFRGGTYNPAANPVASWSSASNLLKYEHLPWNPSNSGTSTNPITFAAYKALGEPPVVFLDNGYGGTVGVVGRDWIIWDGITGQIVEAAAELPDPVIAYAYFQYANNCIFRNGSIRGIPKSSHDNSALIFLLGGTNIIIENNILRDMNDDGDSNTEEAVNAAAILNFESAGMVVKNNDIINNYVGIWDKDAEQGNRYYQNHIYGGTTSATRCRTGIQIRNALNDTTPSPSNIQAYQNIIRNCDMGIWSSYDRTTVPAPMIYNNVIFHTGMSEGGSAIYVHVGSSAAEVYNNIMDGYTVPVRYEAPTSTRISYSNQNSFFNGSTMSWRTGFSSPSYSPLSDWTLTTTFDGNSILTNPLFINAGSSNPADYKLATGSPALGTGRNGLNMGAYPSAVSPSIGSSLIRPKSPVLLP